MSLNSDVRNAMNRSKRLSRYVLMQNVIKPSAMIQDTVTTMEENIAAMLKTMLPLLRPAVVII